MGLFSFSQYGLLNKSQRPRLQRVPFPPMSQATARQRLRTRKLAPPRPPKGTDRYNLKRASFVSMMCIRAVVCLALFHGPRTDARCSRR